MEGMARFMIREPRMGGVSCRFLRSSDNRARGLANLRRKPPVMKALLLTNEYPPNVYGGAGVHVDYLARELAKLMDVEVRCFGDQDEKGASAGEGYGTGYTGWTAPKEPALDFWRGAALHGF